MNNDEQSNTIIKETLNQDNKKSARHIYSCTKNSVKSSRRVNYKIPVMTFLTSFCLGCEKRVPSLKMYFIMAITLSYNSQGTELSCCITTFTRIRPVRNGRARI